MSYRAFLEPSECCGHRIREKPNIVDMELLFWPKEVRIDWGYSYHNSITNLFTNISSPHELVIQWTLNDCLAITRQLIKHFQPYLISSLTKTVQADTIIPFYRWGNQASERWNKSLAQMQLNTVSIWLPRSSFLTLLGYAFKLNHPQPLLWRPVDGNWQVTLTQVPCPVSSEPQSLRLSKIRLMASFLTSSQF